MMSHAIVFMWKEFGVTKDKFFSYWLPFIQLVLRRHSDIYNPKKKKEGSVNADDLSVDQLRQFFTSTGMPVREE